MDLRLIIAMAVVAFAVFFGADLFFSPGVNDTDDRATLRATDGTLELVHKNDAKKQVQKATKNFDDDKDDDSVGESLNDGSDSE